MIHVNWLKTFTCLIWVTFVMLIGSLFLCKKIPSYLTSGCSGLVVEYRTRNREVAGSTHAWSTASNLEQIANLLCAQANSASYPERDGKWVVATATGWRPSVADWGDGVSASCTPWVQLSVSAGNGWPHNALRHHWLMQTSCHFRDCEALLVTSLTHVSGAIASAQTLPLPYFMARKIDCCYVLTEVQILLIPVCCLYRRPSNHTLTDKNRLTL